MDELVIATIDELGMSDLLDGDASRAALTASLRKMLDGRMLPRDLAKWAYRSIGYDVEPDGTVFITMDDLYDESEQFGYDEAELDRWILAEAEAFIAGDPSPGPPPALRQRPGVPQQTTARFRRQRK